MRSDRILVLLVNSQCDIACRYCFYTRGYEKRDGLRFDPALADPLARKLKELGFSGVILTGGDPLSRSYRADALYITRRLQSSGLKVVICTSGAYLTDRDCDELIAARPFRLDFSIDSHLDAVHDTLRGRFWDVIAAIKYLTSHGYHSIVSTTVLTPLNAPRISETIRYLRELGVEDCRMQPAFLEGPGAPDLALRLDKELVRLLKESNPKPRSYAGAYISWWTGYYEKDPGTLPKQAAQPVCQMGKRVFVSTAEGNLSACFHRPEIRLGNFFRDETVQIAEAMESNSLRQHKLPPCVGPHCVSLFDHESSWEVFESKLNVSPCV